MDELEALKQELEQTQLAYQMALQLSQFKGGFLARTAHELRSPLSSLMGLHQLILSDLCDSPEEERIFLQQAYQSAQKLMKIIDDIVAVSKVEYGKISLKIRPISLTKVFRDLENLLYLQAANQNIPIEFILPDGDVSVLADEPKFLQILLMLVDAAISYLTEGNIKLSIQIVDSENLAQIWIDLPCPYDIWSEPVDLLQQLPEFPVDKQVLSRLNIQLSPGTKFCLAESLLTLMQGQLELLALASFTRLQCSIPLASRQETDQE